MEIKWFIGVDISKLFFDAAIYDKGESKGFQHSKFNNNPSGYKNFVKWLGKQGVILSSTLICMEHTGVYGIGLACFLEKKALYCVVNPLQIKRSMGLNRGKNDKIDAQGIARYCYLHREELKPSKLPSESLQSLRLLLTERTRIVKAAQIEKAVISELSQSMSMPSKTRIQERLKRLSQDIKAVEKELLEIIESKEEIKKNYKLSTSVTGIGLVNALLMIVYSNNFEGISNARSFACYSGIAPFEHTSGTSIRGKTRVSHLANKQIKSQLTNAARSAVIYDPEIKKYYKRKKDEGKEHGVIMNAIKFKLVSRVYATVKRGTPFVTLRKSG
jgi:transposase